MEKLNKRADINLSFGVIFSVILIAVFIFAAVYAINFFLDYSQCVQVGSFYDGLQKEVSNAYLSQSTENKKFQISLPSSIDKICFANLSAPITNPGEEYDLIADFYLEDANLFLIPGESACGIPYKKITRLNVAEITKVKNPYCVYSDEELTLTKQIYDRAVLIQ